MPMPFPMGPFNGLQYAPGPNSLVTPPENLWVLFVNSMGMWLDFAQQYNPTLEVVETLDEMEIQEVETMQDIFWQQRKLNYLCL